MGGGEGGGGKGTKMCSVQTHLSHFVIEARKQSASVRACVCVCTVEKSVRAWLCCICDSV